ncbi:ATP-dependent DNA helicase PIF1, partial [Trifolium medium]|nr:ATP-dependent DNA helicase PIF1 [Trifolium medium]
RRNFGVSVVKSDIRLDNRSVVPYNPKLIVKYQAHVNIEYCNKSNCIKYLFKYITKGVDRVTAALEVDDGEAVDEIKQYYDCRVIYKENSDLGSVLSRNEGKNTMFLAWMEANRCFSSGRLLTYAQFPSKFTYDSDDRPW